MSINIFISLTIFFFSEIPVFSFLLLCLSSFYCFIIFFLNGSYSFIFFEHPEDICLKLLSAYFIKLCREFMFLCFNITDGFALCGNFCSAASHLFCFPGSLAFTVISGLLFHVIISDLVTESVGGLIHFPLFKFCDL